MKFKKILSLCLAIITLFSCTVSVCADEIDEKNYIYYGELTERQNKIWDYNEKDKSISDLYVYYTFTLPESGYYNLNYGSPFTSISAEISGELPLKQATFDENIHTNLYYLEKGDYVLTVDLYYSDVDVYIFAGYLGESIIDISFDYDQLLDSDFYLYEDTSGGNFHFESYADATITFSSGKTYNLVNDVLYGTMNSYADGVNDVVIKFQNQSIPSTATVYPISHYVSDITISNLDLYYDGNTVYFNHIAPAIPFGETIIITFTDGTTKSFEYNDNHNYVTLPNGQDYTVYIDVCYNRLYPYLGKGDCYYEIQIGDAFVKEYYFNGIKAPSNENIMLLKEQTELFRKELLESIELTKNNYDDTDALKYISECVVIYFIQTYSILFEFCGYYISLF